CVSKGKYNDLEAKYNDLQGQYTTLQGQYQQLQQASAAQTAKSSADIAALKKEIDAGKVHVSRLQNAIKYTVNSDLLFRSGSWEMSKEGQEVIAKLVPQLAPFQQSKLVVNGYTDNAPVGRALQRQGVTSNEVLSQKRAEAVMAYLTAHGVKPDMISARGLGEADPVASNKTAEGRVQNRPVEVPLAGQTAPYPWGLSDVMYACVSSDGSKGRVPPACGSCDPLTSRCSRRAQAWNLITCRWQALTRETRQGLRYPPRPAPEGEVACGLHPCVVVRHGGPGGGHAATRPPRGTRGWWARGLFVLLPGGAAFCF